MRTLDRGGAEAENDVVCRPKREEVLRWAGRCVDDELEGVRAEKNADDDELCDDAAEVEAVDEDEAWRGS